VLGSERFQTRTDRVNRVDYLDAWGAGFGFSAGLRLAATVPAPGAAAFVVALPWGLLRRRR
jgi:hypothetical protein